MFSEDNFSFSFDVRNQQLKMKANKTKNNNCLGLVVDCSQSATLRKLFKGTGMKNLAITGCFKPKW